MSTAIANTHTATQTKIVQARNVSKVFKRDAFEVFVLTQSKRRLHALQKAAEPIVDADRRADYCFATFEALEPARFAEWEWLDLDDETCDGVLWTN